MKRESKRGGYWGSVITPENRREYMGIQAQAYRDQYLRATPEDQRKPDSELEIEAEGFARYQANREQRHYKAYLAGHDFYKYKGKLHPVMTAEFVKEARTAEQIIDLHKVEQQNGDQV